MKTIGTLALHYISFLSLFFVTSTFFTAIWVHLFNSSAGPLIWVLFFVYWALYRRTREAMLMLYILCFLLSEFSSTSFTQLLFNLHIVLFFVTYFKSRIYWEGPLYYMLATGTCSLLFPLVQMFSFKWFGGGAWIYPNFFNLVMGTLLSMLISLPSYQLFRFIDSKIRDTRNESMEQGYL